MKNKAGQQATECCAKDYVTGPRRCGLHFACGFCFGAALGAWCGWRVVDDGWPLVVCAIAGGLVVGCSCARWGDRAWEWIIQKLPWLT